MNPRHLLATTGLLGLVAAGCTAGGQPTGTGHSASSARLVRLANIAGGPREHVPSALTNPSDPRLPRPLVHPADIRPGGPPPDGIVPVDLPLFQRASTVDWLQPQEAVLALDLNGDSRAYPIQVMIWHEIANDTVGGVPVAVTYCPLCNTAIAYDRRAAGRVLDFGTSGKLYNSDLVAYDRQTQSLWVQFLGRAVAGVLTGTTLRAYPVQTVSWQQWRTAHPDGWVLGRVNHDSYDYGSNPYPGYDNARSRPFLYAGPIDGRLPAKTRVVGIRSGDDAIAITDDQLRRTGVVQLTVADQPVIIWWRPGTRSALQADTVAAGADIGSTGVFSPVVAGRTLHFTVTDTGFRDRETASVWSVLGRAVEGDLRGTQLQPITHVDTFWFAWAAFLPHTRLIDR